MTNVVIDCILSGSAAKYYDPAATLSDDQIGDLVRIGTSAPTYFHMQTGASSPYARRKPRHD